MKAVTRRGMGFQPVRPSGILPEGFDGPESRRTVGRDAQPTVALRRFGMGRSGGALKPNANETENRSNGDTESQASINGTP